MRTILLLLALCATAVYGQQDLCDFTAEADAADIDGLELLMGDPLNACEGYSVSFANFQAALAISWANISAGTNANALMVGAGGSLKITSTGTIDASGVDADGDGTREITVLPTATGFNNAVEFRSRDDSTVRAAILSDGSLRVKTYLLWMDDANVSISNTAANVLTIAAPFVDIALEASVLRVGRDTTGGIIACDASSSSGLIWDADGDLCACPPDGSDWQDINAGSGGGACA